MAHQRPLHGRTALVTGAGRNIGRAIALGLAAQGANVAVNVRANTDEADAVCAGVQAEGVRGLTVVADLAHPNEIDAMFDAVHRELGPVHVLVNNAAVRPLRSCSRYRNRSGIGSSMSG